jgi:hypothetical protein
MSGRSLKHPKTNLGGLRSRGFRNRAPTCREGSFARSYPLSLNRVDGVGYKAGKSGTPCETNSHGLGWNVILRSIRFHAIESRSHGMFVFRRKDRTNKIPSLYSLHLNENRVVLGLVDRRARDAVYKCRVTKRIHSKLIPHSSCKRRSKGWHWVTNDVVQFSRNCKIISLYAFRFLFHDLKLTENLF